MEVGFVTMEKVANRPINTVGTSRIRARWVAKYWPEAEEWIIGKKYDVLIFQKAWWEDMIENFKGIKIMDIADPEWLDNRAHPYFGLMAKCDAVTTSTPTLANYVRQLIQHIPVVCIPDRLDLKEHQQYKKKYGKGEAKSCVWFGYSHNFHYVEKTFDKLMEKNLALTVVSNKPLTTTGDYSALKLRNVTYDYRMVHSEIMRHDIVLLPSTTEDLRGKFKSNNKDLTAMALGMPIAKEPEDLDRLMDPKAREKEGKAGRKEAIEKHDVRLSVVQYKQLISNIKNGQKIKGKRK